MVKQRIAIIPARGGSKRLPGKNIIDFCGKPMIAWTIESTLRTGLFDEVLVSTDSEEIANISIKLGAQVPFLRKEYADDISTVSLATKSALIQMESYKSKSYGTIVQLMANCPLRGENSITKQVMEFEHNKDRNSLLSGFKYGMFNPWWAHKLNEKGEYERVLKNYQADVRSQDLPKLICPTGATWISSRDNLLKYNTFYSPGYRFFEINWKEGVDIDDADDLELALFAKQLL